MPSVRETPTFSSYNGRSSFRGEYNRNLGLRKKQLSVCGKTCIGECKGKKMFNRNYVMILIFVVIICVGVISTNCKIDTTEPLAASDSLPPTATGSAETAESKSSFLVSEDSPPFSFIIMNSFAEFIGSNAPSSILGLAGGAEFSGEEQPKEAALPLKLHALRHP